MAFTAATGALFLPEIQGRGGGRVRPDNRPQARTLPASAMVLDTFDSDPRDHSASAKSRGSTASVTTGEGQASRSSARWWIQDVGLARVFRSSRCDAGRDGRRSAARATRRAGFPATRTRCCVSGRAPSRRPRLVVYFAPNGQRISTRSPRRSTAKRGASVVSISWAARIVVDPSGAHACDEIWTRPRGCFHLLRRRRQRIGGRRGRPASARGLPRVQPTRACLRRHTPRSNARHHRARGGVG